MPKKTKKQKILANLHRKLQYETFLPPQDPKLNSTSVKSQITYSDQYKLSGYGTSLNFANETVMKANNAKTGTSYAYVKNDLIRITIFTLFALASQGVLYFLLRTR